MKLVFATNNVDKFKEIKALIPSGINLTSLNDIGCNTEIAETGKTLQENAHIKAQFIYKNYGLNCFADDTGLEVDVLNGEPGIYSARYAGNNVSYDENVNKLLNVLKSERNRKAQFRTVISLIIDGKSHNFQGVVKGIITKKKSGNKGFGYDPVFKPNNYDKTFAEMRLEEKNKISHRALAFKELINYLNKNVNI